MTTPSQKSFFSGWRHLATFLGEYWEVYGGWTSLARSPYTHIALLVTLATWPNWWSDGWWDVLLGIIPSVLGFTIGGFAIVLTLGTGTYGSVLSSATKPDESVLKSAFVKLGVAFCHFIVVQMLAIGLALFAKGCFKVPAPAFAPWLAHGWVQHLFWFAGWLVGVYSLCLTLAIASWIFLCIKQIVELQKKQFRLDEKEKGEAGKPSF